MVTLKTFMKDSKKKVKKESIMDVWIFLEFLKTVRTLWTGFHTVTKQANFLSWRVMKKYEISISREG